MSQVKIVGRFGGDASRQRAEIFMEELQRKNPKKNYEIEVSEGFFRFRNLGVAVDYYVVEILGE